MSQRNHQMMLRLLAEQKLKENVTAEVVEKDALEKREIVEVKVTEEIDSALNKKISLQEEPSVKDEQLVQEVVVDVEEKPKKKFPFKKKSKELNP